jgi:hypothetical protein
MQDAVETFFQNSVTEVVFSNSLFPGWLHTTLDDARCSIGVKFRAVFDLLHANGSDAAFRQNVYEQVVNTNHIAEICNGDEGVPAGVIDWSTPLGASIKVLMLYLYEDVLDFACFRRNGGVVKARHEFYKEFVKKNKYVCPFCGIGKFKNALGPRREDLDHYLHKSDYPLAAANMRNLIPTCGTCNQDYKKTKDILQDGSAFYPYSDTPDVLVTVDCIRYPGDDLDDPGEWQVDISLVDPDISLAPKMAAWERVYSVSIRLANEVSENFDEWVEDLFVEFTGGDEIDHGHFNLLLEQERDNENRAVLRRMKPGAIVRAAFFDFMLTRAEDFFVESFRMRANGRVAA